MSARKRTLQGHLLSSHPAEDPKAEWTNPVRKMSPVQRQAMLEALQNPLILNHIMADLNVPDFKSCRLVSHLWKYMSSKIMKNRDCSLVCIRFDCKTSLMYERCRWIKSEYGSQSTDGSSSDSTLGSLNSLLKNSTDFPCTHFMLQGGHLESLDCQQFFRGQGSSIKTLALNQWCPIHDDRSQSKPILHKLLGQFGQNLENLTLESFPTISNNVETSLTTHLTSSSSPIEAIETISTPEFKLPALKNLTWIWTGSADSPMEILRAAPNLRCVNGLDDFDLLIWAGKIETVKELTCHTYISFRDPHKLEKLTLNAFSQLRLRKLMIGGHSKKSHGILEAFSKLLRVCQNSLEILYMSTICFDPGVVRLPDSFGRLRVLEFGPNFGGHRIFPEKFEIQRIFPNLRIVDWTSMSCGEDGMWEKYFPGSEPLQGQLDRVHTIKVNDQCTEFWMQKLQNLCPNFKSLVILSYFDLPGILKRIFKSWQHLGSIEIILSYSTIELATCEVDAAFTGMSRENCYDLFKSQVKKMEVIDGLEQFKVNPGITDLKGLKSLKLMMGGGRLFENSTCFSHISSWYGFLLLPQLQVRLQLPREDYYNQNTKSNFWESIVPATNVHRQ